MIDFDFSKCNAFSCVILASAELLRFCFGYTFHIVPALYFFYLTDPWRVILTPLLFQKSCSKMFDRSMVCTVTLIYCVFVQRILVNKWVTFSCIAKTLFYYMEIYCKTSLCLHQINISSCELCRYKSGLPGRAAPFFPLGKSLEFYVLIIEILFSTATERCSNTWGQKPNSIFGYSNTEFVFVQEWDHYNELDFNFVQLPRTWTGLILMLCFWQAMM